jgi:hypothetical protein
MPDVTRKYNFICPIVTVVNKHFCVVVNTVITWKCQSLNVWKYGQSLNFAQVLVKHRHIPTKNLKRTRGTSSVSRRLVFKWHKRFVERKESVDDDNRSDRRPFLMPAHVTRVIPYICALVEYVTCTLHEHTINYKTLCINHSSIIDSKTNYEMKSKRPFTSNKHVYNNSNELTQFLSCAGITLLR